jgi:hypothetical protein
MRVPLPRGALSFVVSTAGVCLLAVGLLGVAARAAPGVVAQAIGPPGPWDDEIRTSHRTLFEDGRRIFRFDTFGSEAFWGGALKLHQAIEGSRFGGVGPGVSPRTALSVGLKVDAEAVPAATAAAIKAGQVNLDDPAVTLSLLKLNAVVGVTGFFNPDGSLSAVGIQCALCHSTVDDSFMPGIGKRLDGWANRDLNVGAIIALSPDLSVVNTLLGVDDATTRRVLAAWGPGKFDAQLTLDGKGFRPDGRSAATLIPPAYGLAGVNNHTWTGGWGTVTYWNAFVSTLEMHGSGVFYDQRLCKDPQKYPIAARAGLGCVPGSGVGQPPRIDDFITGKLAALHFYQLAIPAPRAPAGSFDAAAAARGRAVFDGPARCAMCHIPPLFTEPGWNTHTAEEIGIDDFQARRSPDETYRTAPLRGLWAHQEGGFYHDGRFATLSDVVNHYDNHFKLGLTAQQKSDLVQYLLSI